MTHRFTDSTIQRLMCWLILLPVLLLLTTPVEAATTKVKLILPVETAAPGQTFLAGLELKMASGWHTYWRNPGDAGATTEIDWTLPPGVTAGEIQWPVPEKIKFGDLLTYGYHDEVVLLIPLTIAPTASPASVELKGEASWLECEVQCVKGDDEVSAKLTIGATTKPSEHAPRIEAWKAKLPRSGSDIAVKAQWLEGPGGEKRAVLIEWTPRNAADSTIQRFNDSTTQRIGGADFYPYVGKGFEVSTVTEFLPPEAGKIRLKKQVTKFEGDWPTELAGLLIEKPDANSQQAFEVSCAISKAGPVAASGKAQSLWVMLGFAFL
ncbi:MAG: hypothetical protein L0Y58_11320, partial [Verrucomicrobia subdivision 3 bacterium]|nr:hypothetical protein [Limisphaerales bacterium]